MMSYANHFLLARSRFSSPICPQTYAAILVGEEGNAPTRTIGTGFTDPLVSLTIYSPRYLLRHPVQAYSGRKSRRDCFTFPLSENCHKYLQTR